MSHITTDQTVKNPGAASGKFFRTVTLAAVLAASALVIPQAAEARGAHGGHGFGGGHGGGHGFVGHGGFRGGPGRWWGGRYYGYGVGPCWRWNPFYARWVWVCY